MEVSILEGFNSERLLNREKIIFIKKLTRIIERGISKKIKTEIFKSINFNELKSFFGLSKEKVVKLLELLEIKIGGVSPSFSSPGYGNNGTLNPQINIPIPFF